MIRTKWYYHVSELLEVLMWDFKRQKEVETHYQHF